MSVNRLSIIKYDPADINALHRIVTDCGADIKNRYGLTHWFPPYPIDVMRKNAKELDVYGVHCGVEPIGTFTVGTHGWKYDDALWADPTHKPLYLGKLAILPQYQGNGIGSWCVKQAVRFDAIAKHTRLVSFYRKLAYAERGQTTTVDWRGVEWEIVYFEKILAGS
jgi:GNAT superfamily N-acetyltransferase